MVKAIAYSYWRSIKRGARKFSAVPASVKNDVLTLAKEDVAAGVISKEEFSEITGQPFEEAA